MGKEPVFTGDSCVGYVTSAAYGYTIGTGIAYAWLPSALAAAGHGGRDRVFRTTRGGHGRQRAAVRSRHDPAAGLSVTARLPEHADYL